MATSRITVEFSHFLRMQHKSLRAFVTDCRNQKLLGRVRTSGSSCQNPGQTNFLVGSSPAKRLALDQGLRSRQGAQDPENPSEHHCPVRSGFDMGKAIRGGGGWGRENGVHGKS